MNNVLLVRHPAPFPTESLFGYLLRLTEQNGYTSPFSLLRLIGARHRSSRRIGIDELARVANRDVSELRPIEMILEGWHHFRLLGQSVSPRDLRLKAPAVCPECVASKGFIEAHWDLALMVGCPIHHQDLASFCPKCKRRLRWFRRGLLECSCGATIRAAGLSRITEEAAALLEIIRCKALGTDPPANSSSGLPTAELSALNLRALLFIIRIIGEHRLMIDNPDRCEDPKRLVQAAGVVLAGFPLHFHELLREIGERLSKSQRQYGVRRQFDTFCTGLFKRPPVDSPEHSDFLRIAFLDFAINQWKKGAVDLKFLQRVSDKVQRRFVAFPRFRERFRLGRLTALRTLAMHKIALVTEKRRKHDRTFVDMQGLPLAATEPPRIYSLRTACALIGVSRKVLYSLRRSGHFKTNAIGRHAYGYHEPDIQSFIRQLLALSPVEKSGETPSDCILLYDAMNRYHGTGEGGAGIIRALLSRELPVVGNIDGTVRGLIMPREAFERFANNDRARAYGNARTVVEVAQELHCTRNSVFGLVQRNLLQGRRTPTGFRICEESLAAFKNRYVSLASIASGTHGSAYGLMLQCRRHGIAVLLIKNRDRHGHQGFVCVQDRDAVTAFSTVRQQNKP